MKRFLFLGVALASLGAILASAALSNPTTTKDTGQSSPVSVQPINPANIYASLSNEATEIPATGDYYPVAHVNAGENDTPYAISVSGMSVSNQGSVSSGTCTGYDYQTSFPGSSGYTPSTNLTPDAASANVYVGNLTLKLPLTVSNDCAVHDAVVEVVFTAVGGGD
jgi:hypothetical protein